MFDYTPLFESLRDAGLTGWAGELKDQIKDWYANHGDAHRWKAAVEHLPEIAPEYVELLEAVRVESSADEATQMKLEAELRQLCPWRKGPYFMHGVHIDTEWRSDWKWERVRPHLAPLKDRLVMDIGCGNGYHCWRMAGEGAKLVVGVDPQILFNFQFWAMRKLLGGQFPAWVVPLGIQHLPETLTGFDTVLSMGVLYHRKDPLEHIERLKKLLRPGGELVLETLVIEGPDGLELIPESRYAQMRNVWSVPSPGTLTGWMEQCGLENVRVVDLNQTSTEEQRSTEWMEYDSLPDFLDPNDRSKTVEGYPAPVRAVVIANHP
ncbi:tRNA 5-methoxyuridine(34)/uridine 5-oxyacetic acid(34) synthase CmoB [Verrucomicrobiota bacterium]